MISLDQWKAGSRTQEFHKKCEFPGPAGRRVVTAIKNPRPSCGAQGQCQSYCGLRFLNYVPVRPPAGPRKYVRYTAGPRMHLSHTPPRDSPLARRLAGLAACTLPSRTQSQSQTNAALPPAECRACEFGPGMVRVFALRYTNSRTEKPRCGVETGRAYPIAIDIPPWSLRGAACRALRAV